MLENKYGRRPIADCLKVSSRKVTHVAVGLLALCAVQNTVLPTSASADTDSVPVISEQLIVAEDDGLRITRTEIAITSQTHGILGYEYDDGEMVYQYIYDNPTLDSDMSAGSIHVVVGKDGRIGNSSRNLMHPSWFQDVPNGTIRFREEDFITEIRRIQQYLDVSTRKEYIKPSHQPVFISDTEDSAGRAGRYINPDVDVTFNRERCWPEGYEFYTDLGSDDFVNVNASPTDQKARYLADYMVSTVIHEEAHNDIKLAAGANKMFEESRAVNIELKSILEEDSAELSMDYLAKEINRYAEEIFKGGSLNSPVHYPLWETILRTEGLTEVELYNKIQEVVHQEYDEVCNGYFVNLDIALKYILQKPFDQYIEEHFVNAVIPFGKQNIDDLYSPLRGVALDTMPKVSGSFAFELKPQTFQYWNYSPEDSDKRQIISLSEDVSALVILPDSNTYYSLRNGEELNGIFQINGQKSFVIVGYNTSKEDSIFLAIRNLDMASLQPR